MLSDRFLHWAFALLILIFLLPVWLLPVFPTVDGGAHLYIAWVMRALATGACPIFREYYEWVPYPVPNYASHAVMAWLMGFVSPIAAEKWVISFYIAGFPLAFRYVLRGMAPEQRGGELLAFPLLLNALLYIGLYNYLLSLVIGLFAVGYWWRARRTPPKTVSLLVFAFLCLAAYSTHLFGLALICVLVGGWVFYELIFAWRDGTSKLTLLRQALPEMGYALAGLALPMLAYGWYARAEKIPVVTDHGILQRLYAFFGQILFKPFGALDGAVVGAGMVLLFCYLAIHLAERAKKARAETDCRIADGWLWVTLLLFALLLMAPDAFAGGWMIDVRIAFLMYVSLLLWLAAVPLSSAAQAKRAIIAVLFAVGALLNILPNSLRAVDLNREVLAFGAELSEPSVLLHGYMSGKPMLKKFAYEHGALLFPGHVAGRVLAGRCVVDAALFQVSETNTFPIRFTENRHPYCAFSGPCIGRQEITAEAPPFDLAYYAKKTGHSVEYLMVWGMQAEGKEESLVLRKQIEEDYRLVATGPEGFARLYRRIP